MLKKLLLIPVIGVLATLSVAAAASLDVNGGNEQAGQLISTDIACDTDGVDVAFGNEVDTLEAHYVRVDSIDPACDGSTLIIRLFDAANNGLTGNLSVVLTASGSSGNLADGSFPIPIADIDHANIIIEK